MSSLRQQIVELREKTGASFADIAETLGLSQQRRGVVAGHIWRHSLGIPEKNEIPHTHFSCGCERVDANIYTIPATGQKVCLKHKRQRAKEWSAERRRTAKQHGAS